MSALLWWLPPLIATLVALWWVSRRARQEAARDDSTLTSRELERLKNAISKPQPTSPEPGASVFNNPQQPSSRPVPGNAASDGND